MSNRKENLKKTLGITEYPWSSDDDDDEETPTTVPDPPPRRQSHFDMPGTSGTSGTAPTVPPEGDRNMSEMRKNQARMERDVFWSLLSNPRRVPSLSLPRNSSTRVDVPLALISRASTSRGPGERLQPSAGEAHQRLLAIRKLNRNPGYRACKAFPSLFAGGQQQQHERPGRSSRDPLIENLANAAVARATQNYMRAKQAQAHERPANPQRDEATFSDSPSVEVEELQAMGGTNSPGRDETVNVDQSDDDDVEMEPADESPSLVRNEDAAEQNDENDNSQGDGAGNTSAVTLEEIVEIDAEPDGEAGPSSAPGDTLSTHCTTQEEATNNAESTNNANTEHQPHGIKRKHESPEESEPASVWEFNQSLLRLLECPVCLEWMEPPMSQCRRGHLVCGRCRARLAACPVCRTAFSSVRNRAMEGVADMLRYPCRHGCGREVRLRRRAPHEASCGARRYRCVVPTCADRPPMPHADLAHHFQSKHQPIVIAGAKHSFKVKVNAELHENWVIMALRELFHLRVDVDVRSWGLVVYAAYIGPKCCADTYTYEVTVKGQFNSRKLVYTRATHCDLECSSLNVSRQDCFHLTLDQALNFLRVKNRHCEPEEFLHFSVEITKREDSLRDDSDS